MNIDEEQMLDIAEKCFMRVAEAIIKKSTNVREVFNKFITYEIAGDGHEREEVELLSPNGFLEGVKTLGISDF